MKIDVTQDALLRALVEGIRDERDHGGALMRLMSRLVNEASKQGWFETHWRTEARLRLAQLACGDLPKDWQSAASAFDVIAETARWALKAEQMDSEGRAALLAITQLVDAGRSVRTSAGAEIRPASRPARRRKAKSTGQARRRMTTATAKPAGAAKARTAAKPATARKANGAAKVTKARITAKSAAARKVGATKVSKNRTAQPAKTAAKVPKARTAAKSAAARKANGQLPANQTLPAPASAL
jgi:hypothetical protein